MPGLMGVTGPHVSSLRKLVQACSCDRGGIQRAGAWKSARPENWHVEASEQVQGLEFEGKRFHLQMRGAEKLHCKELPQGRKAL